MRNAASLTLIVASVFLAVVALLVNSPALFYMGTALVATIVAAKLQAKFAVKGLTIFRQSPEMVKLGEVAMVTLSVESQNRFNRPLLLIEDQVPLRLTRDWVRHALPIAPSYQQPVQIQYQFRPLRRGTFTWSGVSVAGTDALGLASAETIHEANKTTLKVLPVPVPFEVDVSLLHGQGYEDTAPKRLLASSIDARGVREYAPGDPVRHVHWASSARLGRLMVKDFESQASSKATVLLQRSMGSDLGDSPSSLDVMCGHAAHLIEQLLPRCSQLELNQPVRFYSQLEPLLPFLDVLADLRADQQQSISAELTSALNTTETTGRIFMFLAVADPELPEVLRHTEPGSVQLYVYNALQFVPKFSGESAASESFIQQLTGAGARVRRLSAPRSRDE